MASTPSQPTPDRPDARPEDSAASFSAGREVGDSPKSLMKALTEESKGTSSGALPGSPSEHSAGSSFLQKPSPSGRPLRVLVLHPPMSIARDFIDYPYFSNLGAVQLAAVLEELEGVDLELVDSFALPGSSFSWREDGRAHLGAPIAELLEKVQELESKAPFDLLISAYTPFHRPPARDDVLGELFQSLKQTTKARLWLADCYQSGQHYVEAAGEAVLASYPEVDLWLKYEAEASLPQLILGLKSELVGSGREGSHLEGLELKGPDQKGSDLEGLDLKDSEQKGTDLKVSDQRAADLTSSELKDSDPQDSELKDSDLKDSDPQDSDLKDSDPKGSDLKVSDQKGTDLKDAELRDSAQKNPPQRRSIAGLSPKLDELPFPAWHRVDLAAYDAFRKRVIRNLGRGNWPFPIDGRTLPLVTSRGCPFACIHCSSNPGREPGSPKTQRRYSAARLKEYLEVLARTHGAIRLEVLDELVNVNERHFDAFLAEMERLDLRFDVPNGMRADYLEPRHFEQMKGRVTTVSVSAESGVQRVVSEVVGKKLDLQAIRDAAKYAHEAGVPLMIHYIIGLPGESAQEINQTLDFAMELWDDFAAWPAMQYATPLPGTGLAQGRELPEVSDWGPYFQQAPSQPGAAVSPELLAKFKWTFDQRLQASTGPQKLIMNVTYLCNNRCTFCAVGTRTQVHGHPTRQREHLVKYRKQGVTLVDFDGGEPTLNPELLSLIRFSRQIGYQRVNVTTNGRMCAYDDYAKKLVRSGLTTLLFSVHGPDARTHAGQVGVAEAFDQTVEGIKNCLRHAPPTVELGMNITITKGNFEKLEAVTQLAWDLGLRWLNIQFLTPFGRATSWVAPDTQAAADIAMGVIDRWRDKMKFQVINLPFCFMPGYEEFMMGDLLKLARHMIFVNNEDVNLGDYLAERRVRKPVCEVCPHSVFCGGFYELDSAPEPPWLVSEEDRVRPVLEGGSLPVVSSEAKRGASSGGNSRSSGGASRTSSGAAANSSSGASAKLSSELSSGSSSEWSSESFSLGKQGGEGKLVKLGFASSGKGCS